MIIIIIIIIIIMMMMMMIMMIRLIIINVIYIALHLAQTNQSACTQLTLTQSCNQ